VTTVVRRASAALAVFATAAGLSLVAAPAGACACGVAIDAQVTSERGLVIEKAGAEQIILGLDLTSDSSDQRAAVVVPVPGPADPTVDAIQGGDPLAYLERATAPPPDAALSAGGAPQVSAAAPVEVIGRAEIGGYDVSRLRSSDPQALNDWLDQNGYTLPGRAEPILSDYIDEGWNFVAIRLARGAEGTLKPLGISFQTDSYVYPMRLEQLATDPVDLTLYVLSPEQAAVVDGLETVWDGPISELDPQPPARLEPIFSQGGYLTRLAATGVDPAQFSSDLAIGEVAPASTPGAPATVADDADGISGAGVALVVAAGGLFALMLIMVMRRRGG
jgi:hypothetical protein